MGPRDTVLFFVYLLTLLVLSVTAGAVVVALAKIVGVIQ